MKILFTEQGVDIIVFPKFGLTDDREIIEQTESPDEYVTYFEKHNENNQVCILKLCRANTK